MTSQAGSAHASPTWVGPQVGRPGGAGPPSAGAPRRPDVRSGPAPRRGAAAPRFERAARRRPDLAVTALLAALWIGLWTVFAAGVALPAAGFHTSAETPPVAAE